jgi:DcuC family C4-dicarboxylate transporter
MSPSALALIVIVVAVGLIARRVDVRLVLSLCALPLFAAAHRLPEFFGLMAREMGNPATVVPICSAMGFSYVLRLTGCDLHLVHLLTRPLRWVRFLLIPGGVAAGYLVNTTIVSQTGAAAVVGPVLVPLLRAGGFGSVTAGSALLLGCSAGGELFNPGAVEMATLTRLTKLSPTEVIRLTMPLNLLASTVALLVYWTRGERGDRSKAVGSGDLVESDAAGLFRVNPFKAAVPLVPIVLLFAAPGLIRLPEDRFPRLSEPATILAAMLVGVVAAGLSSPKSVRGFARSFFEGAGFAYTQVISLIVAATVFAEAIKASGLIRTLTAGLAGRPAAATVVAFVVPCALAFLCGSGIAPAVAVMTALVPEAKTIGLDPVRLGAITSVGAHLGRTMSPAAAVVAMSATLSRADPADLIRRVAPPLLAGGAALLIAALTGLL